MTVAQTILGQLGDRRFVAMTGAKDFVGGDNTLSFRIPRINGINKIVITLTRGDFYDMSFYCFNRKTLDCPLIKEVQGIYWDDLARVFSDVTGLATHL